MKKLTLILDQTNWLEATWVEEVITQVPVEEGEEDRVETTQVHCESYSGHPEHIAMLRAKASEFGTELDKYEELIADCESKFVHPSDDEVAAELAAHTKAEALAYLASTDWYVTRKAETGVEIPEEVSRLRAEARLVA